MLIPLNPTPAPPPPYFLNLFFRLTWIFLLTENFAHKKKPWVSGIKGILDANWSTAL